MSDIASNEVLLTLLRILDTAQVRESLAARTRETVMKSVFGCRIDSYNIDSLEWLVAGITSGAYATERMQNVPRFAGHLELLTYAMSQVSLPGLFLEFGVFSGGTINHVAELRPETRFHGFDSFQGLPEDWRPGYLKGVFGLQALPTVHENVELVPGWFDRTLPAFCDSHPDEFVAFLHVDCDLYSSTQTIFHQLNRKIVTGTIIVFDEYFNYPGWAQHEIRAFREFCEANDVTYRYLGLVPDHQQVAVRITGRG